jgi:hypothetical protein
VSGDPDPQVSLSAVLAQTLPELAYELAALRQEMRGFRDSIHELRDQLGELRRQASEKNEQVIVLRTQHRVLWAVASVAGAAGLGAFVLELIRVLKEVHP